MTIYLSKTHLRGAIFIVDIIFDLYIASSVDFKGCIVLIILSSHFILSTLVYTLKSQHEHFFVFKYMIYSHIK